MVKQGKTTYRRKLSPDEIRSGYILITKNALRVFPNVGEPFKLYVKSKKFNVTIKGVSCACMGPGKPHEHYRIDASKFKDRLPSRMWTEIAIERNPGGTYVFVSK
jgi:hypothetical protein